MEKLILGFITSFVIVLLSTPALIKVAYMKRLVDEPEERKLHTRRIPTIGGIIIFAGTLFAYALWYPTYFTSAVGELRHGFDNFRFIISSMLILFFIGVKDDIIGTAPMKKLIGHIIVAFILVMMADIKIDSLYGIFGVYELPQYASVILSVFTYTVIVNAVNLIDGVDGLAAGVGTIAALSFGTWFYFAGSPDMAILSVALAGALVGFLVFNFQPAKIFMGDSGSLTIGLVLSVLAIEVIETDTSKMPEYMQHISKPIFAMAALVYPLIDTLRIFIYRASKGMSPFSADKNHIHHRLIAIGLNHRKTVLTLYLYNVIVVLSAIFITAFSQTINFILVLLVALSLVLIPLFFIGRKLKKQ